MPAGVVTYRYPASVAGGAVAPTTGQSSQVNEVVADVVFGAGDTVANIVHNMGLSAAGTDGRPRIASYLTAAGTALNNVVITVVDANTVSVTPVLGAANTGLTVRVSVGRPHTLTR